ncbi:MAG: hypothetical protein J6V80_02455 [Clostridia bacterium]|nr:hypothetical protein [Clostridia bacterium]
MNKNDFIIKHSIADARPIDPSRKTLPAEGFSLAIAEFLEYKFHGIVRVNLKPVSAQAILISAEYVALFFKELLTDVYGRVVLDVSVETIDRSLVITISSDEPIPIEDAELRRLIRAARNAGFSFCVGQNAFILTVEASPITIRRVYAISVVDSRRIMMGKFVEIFCHGELMNADDPSSQDRTPQPMKHIKPVKK